MKKKLILLTICLISFSSKIIYSQSANTIVDTNSIWSIYKELVVAEPIPTSYYIHLKGDTIIDSKHYIKVWTNNDLSLTDYMEFHALIREENQKTYVRYYNSSLDSILAEELLYDFSLSNGDTFTLNLAEHVFTFNVSVDSILINNEMRKRIVLSGDFYSNITWVEKIGCLEWGLLYYPKIFYTGVIEKLLCYYYNDNVLYSNPEFNYCNIVGINYTRKEENQIKVYPTLFDKEINISSDKYPICLSVIDLFGREVFRREIYNNKAIDLDFLKKGTYILKLKHNDAIINRKIIKK